MLTSKNPNQHSPRIFISYRRADSRPFTERIHDRLVQSFLNDNVFLDVDDHIPPGLKFSDVLWSTLRESEIVLVIIGRDWLDICEDDNPNLRRLDNPNDWVRQEIETSLGNPNVVVIPILINNAQIPAIEKLPDTLKPLCELQFATVRQNPDFHKDMEKLIVDIVSRTNSLRQKRVDEQKRQEEKKRDEQRHK